MTSNKLLCSANSVSPLSSEVRSRSISSSRRRHLQSSSFVWHSLAVISDLGYQSPQTREHDPHPSVTMTPASQQDPFVSFPAREEQRRTASNSYYTCKSVVVPGSKAQKDGEGGRVEERAEERSRRNGGGSALIQYDVLVVPFLSSFFFHRVACPLVLLETLVFL
jgi:hypothetical protein